MSSDNRQPYFRSTRSYTFKVILLFVLVLVFLIPLGMISGLVSERQAASRQTENELVQAWGQRLTAAGPVVTIPGVRREERRLGSGSASQFVETPFTLVIAPETLNISANLKTNIRKRGIFSVPLFSGVLELSGVFDPKQALASLAANERLELSKAEIVIAVENQKNIRKVESSLWSTGSLTFKPGNQGHRLFPTGESGLYAVLPPLVNRPVSFSVIIGIQTGKELRFVPFGKDTHVEISSDWRDPSFKGEFLPSYDLSDKGFNAVWDLSYLSRDIPLYWKERETPQEFPSPLFGLDFYRPQTRDTYALVTRAVRYAILFLIIPFVTLFLLEVFSRRRINLVPYFLSSIGNVVFYLLLLSLSEQISFASAYFVAAFATTVMLTLFSRSLLWRQSVYYGVSVAVSYTLLYAVLRTESYALLFGSIGTFLVTALVLFATRKLDWYETDDTWKTTTHRRRRDTDEPLSPVDTWYDDSSDDPFLEDLLEDDEVTRKPPARRGARGRR